MRTARNPRKPTETFNFEAPSRPPPAARTVAPRPRRNREVVRREKREKFKEIMGPRAAKAIHDIRLLGYGANKKRYYYTEKDIEVLRQRLLDEVEAALAAYHVAREDPEEVPFE